MIGYFITLKDLKTDVVVQQYRGVNIMASVYRYRKCLKCGVIRPAGQFKIVNFHGKHWHQRGGSIRQCPVCRHRGFTQAFPVMNEHYTTLVEAM